MQLNAIIESNAATGLLVGSVVDVPGAQSQGGTVEEVLANLAEVIELLQLENALHQEVSLTAPVIIKP
jgi:predicted RNase H-like HicB family nuclease